jgi:gas vesicle protein
MTDQENLDQDVELHDDENVMEMSDHEAQSVASADKAGDASGSAPKRKGDQTTQDPMPKTKAALMAAMMHKMQKMDKKSLQAMYKMEDVQFDEDGEAIVEAPRAEVQYEANFEEDLNALVSEEATLSDEFKGKAATIFEAAIKSKLSAEIDRLEEKYNEELAEEISTTKADLVEKVDSYLNYVVEQWMEDNKVAVQAGLRTEIAETFMNNLKDLFVESYVDVPESKVDLVDELAGEVEELEDKLNESTGKIIEMTEELENFKREQAIAEASKDLADTQVEKLRSLVQDIDFGDNFAEKVKTVKESYFTETAEAADTEEEGSDDDSIVETTDLMAQYMAAIKKQNKS